MSDTAQQLSPSAVPPETDLPTTESQLPSAPEQPIQRALLGVLAVCCALALGLGLALAPPMHLRLGPLGLPVWLAGVVLLLAFSGWAMRLDPLRSWAFCPSLALGALAWAALAAWAGGWAALLPAMPMLAAAVGLAAAAAPRWLGQSMLVAALALILGLAWTSASPDAGAAAQPGPAGWGAATGWVWQQWLPALLACTMLLAAAALGSLISSLVVGQQRHAAQALHQRETLLRLSTDAYWETDASLRLRAVLWRDRRLRLVPVVDQLGRRPWDVPVLSMHPESQDLLRADTEARDAFTRLLVAWRCADGQRRHFLVSGQPAFDAQGRFSGYWGVARDVSAERQARRATRAANEQYQRLFRRNPTPLILHRHGRILSANAAAARLLGYERADEMTGHDLLLEHMDDEQRELAVDRVDELDAEPQMEALPVVPRRLLRCDGSPVYTLATGMRADQAGRPAMLAIYLDETARHAAVLAQHRSDTLMSRLLAISPDLVALTALDGGQCVMVNDSLGRLLGHARGDWVGPSASGPWRGPADRHKLARAVEDQGVVRDLPMVFLASDGREVTLLVSATRVTLDDGMYLLFSARPPGAPRSPWTPREAALVGSAQ